MTGARVYNIACGGRYTLNQLFAALRDRIGARVEPVYGPSRPGDVKHSMAGIERIQRELGYQVGTSFEEGIDRTVQWYQTVGLKTLG